MPKTDGVNHRTRYHRLLAEADFHDRQARQRAATFSEDPEALRFRDDEYLGHESWVRPAFAVLGDVRGLDVLDYGCGHGMASVVLARRGARVCAFDVSTGYLREARLRVQANSARVAFARADGERLPFADGSFDRIWAHAVLHHLEINRAAPELARVLRPGGRAVLCEPWGENPLLNHIRARLHYPEKQRTADERPLRQADLRALHLHFTRVEMKGFQLLEMVRRVLRSDWLSRGCRRLDDVLLSRAPGLNLLCRYVVLTLWR